PAHRRSPLCPYTTLFRSARGGVIAYLTRAGGERVQASFHGGTDEPFGAGSSLGYNRFAAFVSGPLRAVPGLTWAFSASAQGEGSPYRGAGIASQPAFVMNGLDTAVTWVDGGGNTVVTAVPAFARVTGLKRPMDWATLVRGHRHLRPPLRVRGARPALLGRHDALQRDHVADAERAAVRAAVHVRRGLHLPSGARGGAQFRLRRLRPGRRVDRVRRRDRSPGPPRHVPDRPRRIRRPGGAVHDPQPRLSHALLSGQDRAALGVS